eukprot:TRINITY_DN38990_c0_g1_i1.p1 TRINITY_DN38990_c0_g1~~TRINITY_DN38990_c0_g1_i1.p1  ORF type:complete len:216 (+),score=40.98 TRINITY_DN38990_c0_g1_i1:1-648(+)
MGSHDDLVQWRLKHGETEQGRPFYDKPSFSQWCSLVNMANERAEEGAAVDERNVKLSPASVEELHRACVFANEGEIGSLATWKAMCDALQETAQLSGCIDAPLRESGERATHVASQHGHVRNLKWLLQNGADANASCAIALGLAADGSASSGLCPAHCAAMYGQVGALVVLHEAGADLNCRRPDGATPLDFAEDTEQIEAAAWLSCRGAVSGLES